MKKLLHIFFILFLILSCGSSQVGQNDNSFEGVPEDDIVRIENKDIEYEIIIIEPGFNSWLNSMARPEGYYSQQYMETRNQIMVQEWNRRVLQPTIYNPNLYELRIDYSPNIDYGYEVNFKLYNYFIYFQLTYNQRLASFIPRI